MTELIRLEVENGVAMMGFDKGDFVVIDTGKFPRSNGEELGMFKMNGESFISPFTRFGKQILFLQKGQPIRVVREERVEIIGTVVGHEFSKEKAPAVTGAHSVHAFA